MTNTQVGTQTSPNGATSSSTASMTTHNVGDLIVFTCTIASSTIHVTGLSSTHTTGWTEISAPGVGATERTQMWWGTVSSVGTATVTPTYSATSSGSNSLCWNFTQFHSDISGAVWSVDSSSAVGDIAASTTLAGATLTPSSGTGMLGYEFWGAGANGTNGTTSGWSWLALDFYSNVNGYNLAVNSATTPSATQSSSVAYSRIAALFKPSPPFTPISGSDSGTGTDTATIQPQYLLTDPGTGADTPAILNKSTVTDTATGTDTPAVQILTPIAASDSGTGTDTPTIFPFVPFAATDSATSTDTPTIAITTFVPQTDTGTGVDTTAIKDIRAGVADSATGADTPTIQRVTALTDSAIGVDDVAVVDIPFTQVLPLFRQGVVYDLVVMARIPVSNGPPQFVEVDPIQWTSLSWTNALSTPQEMTASCLVASLPPTIITRLRDLATQPTELWLSRNGKVVFAGPIQGGTVSGENLTLNAKGLMTYLMGMFVTSDLVFKGLDQFQIVKGLVDHWQNLDYGNFGIDTTHITNSGVTMDVNYLKTELDNIGQKIADMGKSATGFDIEIDPSTRQLQLWYPTKGIDKSVGEDAVVFDARNISSSDIMFSVGVNDVASEGFGTGTATNSGDGNTYSVKSNVELRARYGRTGIAASFSNVDSQTVLDTFVQALIDARQAALMVPGPQARDVPDADISSYSVGDTILYQPNELLTISAAYRIRKQTVTVSSTSQETLTLEFV